MHPAQPLLIMIGSIVLLYILSRFTLNGLFRLLQRTFYKDRPVYILIALFFFPGTLLHELAHYIAAILLLLEVKSLHLLPEWKGNELKLGKVIYIQKDFFRGILVGVAPVIAGVVFFLVFSAFRIFPSPNIWVNIASVYILLVVSTMMFSSRQDLIDFVYILPIIIIIAGLFFIFKVNPLSLLAGDRLSPLSLLSAANPYIERIDTMLFITIAVHMVTVILLKIINHRRR